MLKYSFWKALILTAILICLFASCYLVKDISIGHSVSPQSIILYFLFAATNLLLLSLSAFFFVLLSSTFTKTFQGYKNWTMAVSVVSFIVGLISLLVVLI